ncbi:MAG: TIGR00725 family protein [Thermodesulfobacteriota bacterium]
MSREDFFQPHQLVIGVVGAASPTEDGYALAREVGRLLAQAGAVVLCGGLGGIMEGACLGAGEGGGLSVGLLPGSLSEEANPYLTIPLPTALDHTRNAIIARAARGLIAVEGGLGTISEMALALKMKKPVVGLATKYDLPGLVKAATPREAVNKILTAVRG